MEVLLTGNTEFITLEWVKAAFPNDHVLVTCNTADAVRDKRLKAVALDNKALLEQLTETYEFERVVNFSEYLTPHTNEDGGLDRLRRILRACVDRPIQFIYISGPLGGMEAKTGKTFLEQTAEQLCFHYAAMGQMQAKVLRAPYLYAAEAQGLGRYISELFAQTEAGSIAFDESAQQGAFFLCIDDLAELLNRMFDSWTAESEIFRIPDVFGISYKQLGEALKQQNPDAVVQYGTDDLYFMPPDDHILRTRFRWFARYGLLDDLPEMYSAWKKEHAQKKSWWKRAVAALFESRRFLIIVETIAACLIANLFVRMTGGHAQFRMVDFRLLAVVLIGTMHGLNAGLFAAVLSSIALALGYYREGSYFSVLFYEPSNWLAFIAYFVAGAACGYVQLRNAENIRFVKEENNRLRERFRFVHQLYQDTLEDKRSFRRQLLGRQDSFGKIYAVTQQLDVIQPQELYAKTVQVMEDLLKNHTITIYRVDSHGRFARLAAACPAIRTQIKHSILLDDQAKVMRVVERGQLWVNRELEPGVPMFASAVRQNGRVVVLIALHNAEGDQLSLYFQNLFRILCGLVETALIRAFEYEKTMREAHYLPDSCIMRAEPFAENLRSAAMLQESKIASHLLLRVTGEYGSLEELAARLEGTIRESDLAGIAADGSVCLLMNQATEAQLPIICERLIKKNITVRPVSLEEELAFVSAQTQKTEAAQ